MTTNTKTPALSFTGTTSVSANGFGLWSVTCNTTATLDAPRLVELTRYAVEQITHEIHLRGEAGPGYVVEVSPALIRPYVTAGGLAAVEVVMQETAPH